MKITTVRYDLEGYMPRPSTGGGILRDLTGGAATFLSVIPMAVMAALLPKKHVAWSKWLRGIMAGFIGGGAGAIGGGFSAGVMDSAKYNLANPAPLLRFMFGTFVIMGILHAAAYLAKNPIPDIVTVTTTETVSRDPDTDSTVTHTVEETRTHSSDPSTPH